MSDEERGWLEALMVKDGRKLTAPALLREILREAAGAHGLIEEVSPEATPVGVQDEPQAGKGAGDLDIDWDALVEGA